MMEEERDSNIYSPLKKKKKTPKEGRKTTKSIDIEYEKRSAGRGGGGRA